VFRFNRCLVPFAAAAVLIALALPAVAVPIPDVTNAGDFIIPIDLDGVSSSPGAEQAPNTIDNNNGTKSSTSAKPTPASSLRRLTTPSPTPCAR
jgi:hypothetical protein